MTIQVSVPQWLALPMEVRMRMVQVFGLNRSGGTITENNQVKSDGYLHQDLVGISVEKMQGYLGVETDDFVTLFDLSLEKVISEITPPKVEEPPVNPNVMLVEEWAANLARMKQRATDAGLTDHLIEIIKQTFNVQRPQTETAEIHQGTKSRGRKAKANS